MPATATGSQKRRNRLDPTLPATKCSGAGRPSKYRPEYCDIVESLGRKGRSPAQIASILNIDRASLYRWARRHDDFAQSLARARDWAQAYWEQRGQDNVDAVDFQAGVWCMSMAARFEDYRTRRCRGRTVPNLGSLLGGAKQG